MWFSHEDNLPNGVAFPFSFLFLCLFRSNVAHFYGNLMIYITGRVDFLTWMILFFVWSDGISSMAIFMIYPMSIGVCLSPWLLSLFDSNASQFCDYLMIFQIGIMIWFIWSFLLWFNVIHSYNDLIARLISIMALFQVQCGCSLRPVFD